MAIDLNVYSRNQEFRLINCSKFGQTNTLKLDVTFDYSLRLPSNARVISKSFEEASLIRRSLLTTGDVSETTCVINEDGNWILFNEVISSSFPPQKLTTVYSYRIGLDALLHVLYKRN